MKKGFTLLELLIVVGILAILSTTLLVVINPAELLRRTRDSQRLSDLDNMRTAIGYYIVNTTAPFLGGAATNGTCANGGGAKTMWSSNGPTVFATGWATSTFSNARTVDGTGWVPINFAGLPGGSPIGTLPVDPTNSTATANPSLYYVYTCEAINLQFEINANMESTFYRNGGTGDVESKDGGDIAHIYELGTILTSSTVMPAATSTNFFPNPI